MATEPVRVVFRSARSAAGRRWSTTWSAARAPSIERARLAGKENGLAVVLPYPERDGVDFYDSISVMAPDGLVAANYRKTHLYGAAERRNYSFGQDLPTVVTGRQDTDLLARKA
ncbi:putative amidohydrolase [Allostreptomyces psammosilenae]|uniref:Putative amidohydrolase n=1 Tax=Allostreptomyces psammosilenae TaxID=1892865 RepID=A0A853A0U2_9ACTN|nr:nitrilase-related carbon-nitrogen hydrolase [Allostreptomyces psammosilenae]NYI07070.1 putative amidohydrolase [Allostreptomyces psammosilenae]